MKSLRSSGLLLTIGASFAGAACCPTYAGTPKSVSAEIAPLTDDGCELRLYIEHTQHGLLGMSAVEESSATPEGAKPDAGKSGDAKQSPPEAGVVDGVCVKRPGKALALPSRIVMAARDMTEFGALCDGDEFDLADQRKGCVWNHTYRNRYPFTFTFVANAGSIADYLSLVRVYRNGSLIARYNAASKLRNERVLTLQASEIRVPSDLFVSHPPHLAPLDLRILPAGAPLDPSLLDENVVDYRERAKERSKAIADAALGAVDPQFKQELECAQQRILRLKAQAESIAHRDVKVPDLDASCPKDVDLPVGTPSLEELYSSQKGVVKDKLIRETEEKLSQLSAVRDALPKVRQAVEKAVGAGAKQLAAVDRELDAVARTCDDTLALAQQLRGSALDAVRNREAQARVYDATVAALAKQDSVFEQYSDNPPALPDEHGLEMQHSQRSQWFALAPWNGVPLSLASGGTKGELQLANAIPIIDAIGFRFQWARSRFADFRVGLGGMYFRDQVPTQVTTTDAAGDSVKTETKTDRFHGAVQLNVGLANFKFGVAWVPDTTQPGARNWSERELRVLIGSDLLKLISGNNVEAL